MGKDAELIIGVLDKRITEIRDDIRESRAERREQIATIHIRLNDHAERIRNVELKQATMNGKCAAEKTENFWGSLQTKRGKVTGIAAIAFISGLFFCVYKWGPNLLNLLWN